MNKMIREIICVKICPFLIALILFSFSVGITVKADESDIIPEDPSSPVGTYSSDSAVSTYRGLILYPPVKQKGKGKGKKITQITPLSGGSTTLDLNCPPPNWVSVPGAGTPDEFYKVINWLDLNTSSLTNFAKSFWYFPEQNSDPGYCILSHTNEPAAWAIINFGTNAYDHANGLILRMLSMREEQNTTTCLAMETLKGDECRNIELRAWGMCDGTDPAHPYIYGDNAIPGVTCTGTDSPASIDQVNYYLFKATNADCDYSFPPSEPFVPPNWVDWFPISGENAWVAIAAVHYYDLTGDTIALDVAKKAADGAILLQVTAPGIAQGGIRMAPEGTYHEPQNPSWYDIISTENNLSWYAAFRMLYEKTDDEKYQNALMGIEQYLQAAFDPSDVDGNPVNGFQPGFVQGMNFEQGNWIKARKFATDCQTWAIDVLGAQEIDDWFGEETAMNIWRSTKTLAGVYDGGNLQGVDFTDYNRTDLNRAPMISYEWTGGAILATYLLDQYYRNQHPAWADEAQVDENTMKNYTLEDAFSVEGEAIRIEDYYEPGMASPVDIIAWPYASGSGNMINRPTGHGWYAPSREVKSLASTAWMSYINREPPFNPFYLGIPSGGAPPETNIGTPRFKTIDGGKNHSIAVKQNGSVWTWGNNSKGQIGDGSVTESLIPKQVIINGYGKEVTATNESSYVLLGDGTVKSWGNNNYGQLGDGTTVGYSTTPVNVLLPSGIISIAGGYNHMLALRDDGTVWAWGRNDGGQLGVEPSQHKNIPIQVPGLDHIKAIAAGTEHSVALKEDGTVWTWGTNHYGQLGRTNTYPYIPARVPCLTSIKNIASSLRHVLALSIDGTVWGWGLNQYNQLGLDEAYPDSSRNIPIKIPNINNVKEIAAGAYHSLFLLNDGTVVSKGGHPNFEVGDPASLSQITDIGCGLYHSFAIHNNGSLWAWGYNQEGQIGNGEKGNVKATPVQVPHFNFWQALLQTIDGGVGHTIALKQDKTIWTWGLNSYGQLGDGTLVDRYNPTQITGLGLGKEVAATHKSTYALLEDGTVWAWGWNQFGQLGNGTTTDSSVPVNVLNLSNVKSIAGGVIHALALKEDGTVWAWGDNSHGQLGDGTTVGSNVPNIIPGLDHVKAIAAGRHYSVALKEDGTVWTWGNNTRGELGNGTTIDSYYPIQVLGLADVKDITAGFSHVLALKNDGSVMGWGWKQSGQLGINGSYPNIRQTTPVQIPGVSGAIDVAAGFYHSLFLLENGLVMSYGKSLVLGEELGDPSGLTQIAGLAIGYTYSFGIASDGKIWAWGANEYGQIGDGTTTVKLTPVEVPGFIGLIY